MIQNKTYYIKNQIFTSELLKTYISKFWLNVFSPLVKDEIKHLMILCKIQYSDESNTYKTLGPLRRVEHKDLDLFIDYLTSRLGILIESYEPNSVSKIIFTYVVRKGEITTSDRVLLQDLSNKDLPFHEFNKIKLPISMNPADYGTLLLSNLMDGFTRFISTTNKRIFQIDVSLDQKINKVTILGTSDLKWIDTKINDSCFKREIGKATLYFFDGELILQKQQLNAKTFRKLKH